jgi:predicted RNA-binding Zn-ribbon protein involved in translation (DUF1610 family)
MCRAVGYADDIPVMAPTSTNSCPSCGSQETLRVTMTVAGSPLAFASCPACEWKGWEREGKHVALGSVLALVSTR